MRVLLASDFYHPMIGGAERQMGLLAGALAGLGHEVRVATTAQPGLAAREVIGGIDVLRLGGISSVVPAPAGGRRFLPPAPDPVQFLGLRRLIRTWRPDIVHASGWIAYGSAAAVADHAAPLVLSVRDYGHGCATRTLLWRDRDLCEGPSLGRCLDCAGRHYGAARALIAVGGVRSGRPLLRRTVTAIHSVSRFVQATVERDLLQGDPGWRPILDLVDDIVPGASEPLEPRDRVILARLPREPFVLFVGALQAHKGVDVLLEAWRQMPAADGQDAAVTGSSGVGPGHPRLVLIGSGRPGSPESLPQGVTVLSDVPHRVVMAAWERCLFGVVPSVWPDPLPGVAREAMTRGRAVIGSAIGGIPDMIRHDHNGLLVPPGDPRSLLAAMSRLAGDPGLRERLGDAGRASVADLDADTIGRRFEQLYLRCRRAGS